MDMIHTFRIMTGIDALEASDFFTTNTRESHDKVMEIMKQPSRLDLRKFSFSHREEDDWNSLPSKTAEARDICGAVQSLLCHPVFAHRPISHSDTSRK